MVSFRFFLVSLVAVFLALGLGVLTGTTVINRGIVAQLEDQTDRLVQYAGQLREDVVALQAFTQEAMGHLVTNRLEEVEVLLIAHQATDAGAIEAVRAALGDARARVLGLLMVDGSVAAQTDGERQDLAEALRADPAATAQELEGEAAVALATRLVFGTDDGEPDVLQALVDAGFVVPEGLDDDGLRGISEAQAVVVIGGSTADAGPQPATFLVPFVETLVEAGARVLAVEATDSETSLVEILRNEDTVDGRIVTQDNIDEIPGQIGLVLGIDGLLVGRTGDYGVKDGAESVIPPQA